MKHHCSQDEVDDDLIRKNYYFGIYVTIHSIITGKKIWNQYQIDFGEGAYRQITGN